MLVRKTGTSLLLAAMLVITMAACEKEASTGPGPAQRAGEKIDRAAGQAGEELNKVGEKVGELMQKAGAKIENAAQDAQDKRQQDQQDKPAGAAVAPAETQKK